MGTDHRGRPLNNNTPAQRNADRLKGFSLADKEKYGRLKAAYPNLSHDAILNAMDQLYKAERYESAERIMGGDYEHEMEEDRRTEREAPYAEGGYEDAARQDRLGMME